MCLYPKLILNPKYKANKKNGWNPPPVTDERVKYVPIGCQTCIECRKKKSREWKVRLTEEIRQNKNGKFVAFTFSNESISKLTNKINSKRTEGLTGYQLDNEIATHATRLFLENWRAKHKKSLRHWLITELGHQGTENIHIHGIVWTDQTFSEIRARWTHGYIYPRPCEEHKNYVNERSIGYIVKYITKIDKDHKQYKSVILTSNGIGAGYEKRLDARNNKFNENGETNELYRTRNGTKIAIPIYYRNKIYSEQNREKLWIQKLDKQERWVLGNRIDISTPEGEQHYKDALKFAQQYNKEQGYDVSQTWEEAQYEREKRLVKQKERYGKRDRAFGGTSAGRRAGPSE